MIDVSGDVIYFEGRPVGFIIIPNGTMRDRFMETLIYEKDDSEQVKELQSEIDALEDTISSIRALCD